jgi:hypothetical protein
MIAIINLLTNIFITGTSIIGCATIINRIGNFCKIIEQNQEDGFKKAFDNVMIESIDDMNKCVESISAISSNVNNIMFILYDIVVGNKIIKKNKDGKIIVCGKAKIYSGFKDKIDELKNKVKKYETELKKIKGKNKESPDSDSESDLSSNDSDSSNSELLDIDKDDDNDSKNEFTMEEN